MIGSELPSSQTIIQLVVDIPLSQKNCKILTKYFTGVYASSPQEFAHLIGDIKESIAHGQRQKELCKAYLKIFSFLCEKFGVYHLKLDLDDICFSLLEPNEHKLISKKLEAYKKQSKRIIEDIQQNLSTLLKENKINATVSGRYKNIYSVYQKCKKKGTLNALKLGDIFAFRIITDTNDKRLCFKILHIIHDSFDPIPRRYKDYISIPKINGYQSLHTALLGISEGLDIPIELQIRTQEMHEISEYGVAAHYLYAKEKKSALVSEKEIKLYQHIVDTGEIMEQLHCLTPERDIIVLKQGSTVSDFAEKIHSKLKKSARYALVNNTKKNLSYTLQAWDTIEIIK